MSEDIKIEVNLTQVFSQLIDDIEVPLNAEEKKVLGEYFNSTLDLDKLKALVNEYVTLIYTRNLIAYLEGKEGEPVE